MNIRLKLISVLLILGIGSLRAQDVLEFTLSTAIEQALNNNTQVKNAELDTQIAKKKIWETTAIGLPQLTAKGQYTNIFKVPEVSFGPSLNPSLLPSTGYITKDDFLAAYVDAGAIALGVKENTTVDFTLSQLLFSGSYIVGLQASKVYAKLSEQNLQKTKIDITESVTVTYCMVLVSEESRRVLLDNLANVEKTLSEIKEMYGQGFVEKTDVDQLEITASNLKSMVNQIDRSIEVSYNLLKIQLGVDETSKIKLTNKLEEIINQLDLASLTQNQFSIEQNIDYNLLLTSEKLAKLDYNRERTEFLPTVAAYFNHTERLKKPDFDFQSPNMLGVTVSLPIFNSGGRLARVAQKRMAWQQAQNNKEYVGRNLELQVSQQRSDLISKFDTYQNQLQSKNLSSDIYDRTLIKYKQGVASSLELMNTQNQYLQAVSNYFQSIFDVIRSKANLEKLYSKGN